MAYAAFRSIGAYVPEKILTNEELSDMVDTSDEWITKRTGIKERHIASQNEFTSDLGTKAAQKALERSGIDRSQIDMVITATISPDYFCMPSTATIISTKLGIKSATAFDISAACTGFIYVLAIAKAFIESGMKKNI
ncbi:MAG TPA: 3-oxoacyl-ACP synthase, partial [Sulfurimonas autotrophica]|nr:3-oxoacyl-ACP synthase [Sulfurimonas autotrophica]